MLTDQIAKHGGGSPVNTVLPLLRVTDLSGHSRIGLYWACVVMPSRAL